jgi:caffeoyl-CoA O-methyltransferase
LVKARTNRKLVLYEFSALMFQEAESNMIKRLIPVIGVLLSVAGVVFPQERSTREPFPSNPPVAQTEAERKILAIMDHMMKFHQTYLSVPPQDGEALRLLAEAADAKNIVEIGTSTGYSGLWFCLALQKTGGHLMTFEINPERAATARGHFQDAGVGNLVTIVEGDAHEKVVKLKMPIDVAFIDADKPGYVDYLNKLLPLVQPGGLILAHNVEMVPDYVKAVTTNPDLETIFYMQGAGLAVTLRKR